MSLRLTSDRGAFTLPEVMAAAIVTAISLGVVAAMLMGVVSLAGGSAAGANIARQIGQIRNRLNTDAQNASSVQEVTSSPVSLLFTVPGKSSCRTDVWSTQADGSLQVKETDYTGSLFCSGTSTTTVTTLLPAGSGATLTMLPNIGTQAAVALTGGVKEGNLQQGISIAVQLGTIQLVPGGH